MNVEARARVTPEPEYGLCLCEYYLCSAFATRTRHYNACTAATFYATIHIYAVYEERVYMCLRCVAVYLFNFPSRSLCPVVAVWCIA